MPAFVDWNSLLFGSSLKTEPRHKQQEVASNPEVDASPPKQREPVNVLHESEVPEESLPERGDIAPRIISSESLIPETVVPETLRSQYADLPGAIRWNAVLDGANEQFTIGAIFLGSIFFLWLLFGRRKEVSPLQQLQPLPQTQPLSNQDEVLDAVKKDFAQKTEALEKQHEQALKQQLETHDQALKQQLEALEERFQKVLSEQSEAIEEQVRKSFNKRVEALEVRIKLDQEALNDVHRALSERMEVFEGFVQTIDAKQLDQEANSIAQRTLGQRLDAVEEGLQNVDTKARASSQRIEAMDDSIRVIDSRAKALSQRLEAAEDNLNTTDGQVTLMSHDVNRGSSVIEKLQRQVKSTSSLSYPRFYCPLFQRLLRPCTLRKHA